MKPNRLRRALSLSLVGVLALATSSADAGAPKTSPAGDSAKRPAATPANAPSLPQDTTQDTTQPSKLPLSALVNLMSEQSIYIPCYAFVPLTGGARKHWQQTRSGCYMLMQNVDVILAAPVHIPVTHGKLRLKKLRCYAFSDTRGDRIEYTASVQSGNTALATMDVVQNRGDAPEDFAKAQPGADLDPATQHYDLAVSWQVEVAAGKGWRPDHNVFHGCRVDYLIENT